MADSNEVKKGGPGDELKVFRKYYNDMIKIIPITSLSGHFVSANIITPSEDEEVTSPTTPTERARTFLLKMSGPLEVGQTESFYRLLEILESFGNEGCSELASKMKKEISVEKNVIIQSNSLTDKLTTEYFQSCGNPTTAFQKLQPKMETFFSNVRFSKLRRASLQVIGTPGGDQFSGDFTDAISHSKDLDGLLDVLTEFNYWNWIDIRFMEAMVNCLDNEAAVQALESYKEYVSAFKLKDVLPEIPVQIDPVSDITIEEKISSSDGKTLTVGDILKHRHYFSYEVCELNPNIPKLCSIKTGCLQLLWSIPRKCASHVYKSALVNIHKIESILYLKIEYYPTIYSPKYSLTGSILPEEHTPPTRKRPLESNDQQTHSLKYFKPSTLADEFSCVVDQVTKLLQSYDPRLLVEHCTTLMASDVHNISFFSNDQLTQLKEYTSTPMLLQELSHLWSWSNHSVLRVLVGPCDEAVKLLDEFDCHLDPFEPISSYPVSEIVPTNATTQTILEMKCCKSMQQSSLQGVIDMGSLVVNKCEVTQHCLQLLGAAQGSIILSWSIPKCVMHLISAQVLQHCKCFYEKGVLEVLLYPHVRIDVSRMADLNNNDDVKQDLSKQLQHVRRQYESVHAENIKLKKDESSLLTSLQTQEQKCKELGERCNKIQEDVEGKIKERIASQQSKCKELKIALDKVVKTFDKDVEPLFKPKLAEEEIVEVTTVVENLQQLEYETDDLQKLIEQAQVYANEAKKSMDITIQQQNEKQDLSKQLQHVRRQFEGVLDENKKLRQDESNLLTSLQTQEQKYKELEERCNKMQEDVEGKTKERIASQQNKFRDLKLALDKVIKTLKKDAELPTKVELAEGKVPKITTVVENFQQLENETEDMQKLIEQLQCYAYEAKERVDISIQQQKQHEEDINELNTRLSIKEKEIAKLKEDNRLLLKRSGSKESKQVEVKVDKNLYPVQYELLGSGNYGKVHKVQYKDNSFAGKVFHNELLPGYPNVPMNKLVGQFTLKCHIASKLSHPNVEQFVEIAHANNEGVPMIITELLSENLTSYISHTPDTLHYNQQLTVCNDMAQGLHYLHSQQLVHGNLHGANVLMTHDHHAKIADYVSPLLLTTVALNSSSVYLPPETIQNKHTTVRSNVFTLAVLFLQVVTKQSPQPSDDLSLSELERRYSDLQNVPKCHPLLEHIQQCLNNNEVTRPLMREVCDYLAKLLKDKDSPQMMAFKLIHTTEYPPLLPALTTGRYQLKHIQCQNLPVPMYWAYAVTIGKMVYVTGGNSRNGDAVEHVYKYDLENNQWDKLPPSKFHHCVPVVLEGKLSLIGGRKPSNKAVIGKVNTYDEESEKWVTIYPDMNQPRYRPAVVINDSHVIVLGGKIKERSKLTDTIEIMNIKDKQWTTLATPLPDKMYDMSATISNDLVWIIGYDNGSNRSNKVFTVSLGDLIGLTDFKHTWKQLRNDTVCFKTAVVSYSDPPVILGGDDRQNKTVSAVVAFDPKTESWSEVAALSSARAHCTVVKLPGERGILAIGGCTETKSLSLCNSSCLKTAEIYYVSNS